MNLESLSSLTEADAYARFDLPRVLETYGAGERKPGAKETVGVSEGDLHVEGDLLLDWDLSLGRATGLVVTGDLSVSGSILNTSGNGGPFLLVLGSLAAGNLVAGGAEIRVMRGARVAGLVLGHYNDGHLRIDGETVAALLVNDDHSMNVTTRSPYWNGHDLPIGFPLRDHLHAEVPVETREDGLAAPYDEVSSELLIERLVAGKPVLRAPRDPRPRKTYAEWTAHVASAGAVLAYVPEALVDEALCRAAISSWPPALQYVPERLRTEALCDLALEAGPDAFPYVPTELRTRSRCEAAVARDGRYLADVPEALRTPELCRTAILADEHTYAIEAVPREHLTDELLLLAVTHNSSNLRYVPEEQMSVALCVASVKDSPWALRDVPEALREEVRVAAGLPEPATEALRAAEGEELLRRIAKRSKTRLFLEILFGSLGRDGASPTVYSGLLGELERRPGLVLLLRFTSSLAALGVHAWLSVHAFQTVGLWWGLATLACFLLAEVFWGVRLVMTVGVTPLAVACAVSAVLYVAVDIATRKVAIAWKERDPSLQR